MKDNFFFFWKIVFLNCLNDFSTRDIMVITKEDKFLCQNENEEKKRQLVYYKYNSDSLQSV